VVHAGPLHAADDVIDAGFAVQADDLLGDLVRRTDQEAVAG
jgi:hypothetical protein